MKAAIPNMKPAHPLWVAAHGPGARWQAGDLVDTNAFGKRRTWRCIKDHRSSHKRNPLRKEGADFWEEVR